jgi:hypothetical protein
MAYIHHLETAQSAPIQPLPTEGVDVALGSMTDERKTAHLNITVEISELIEVISEVLKSGGERITLLLGLFHRLSELNELQCAFVHDDDVQVRAQIARTHSPKHVEFIGSQTVPTTAPSQPNAFN